MARSKTCWVFILIFFILSIITFILVVVAVVTVDFRKMHGWDKRYDNYIGVIIAVMIIVYYIPIMHCAIILSIRRRRLLIAKEMQSRRINPVSNYAVNQNLNVGNQYLPPQLQYLPRAEGQAQSQSQVHVQPQSQVRGSQVDQEAPPAPTLVTQTPSRPELPTEMPPHPYLVQRDDDETESLLGSASRRSSAGGHFKPGIK